MKQKTKQIEYQLPPPQEIVGFFHGIDTATQNDYYTDVVHVLPAKPKMINIEADRYKWLPYLVGIMRLKKMEPNEMIDTQIKYFNKFPPHRADIDSSREEFLVNALIRKYGETTIEPVKFLNAGTSNTKFQLKQIGYAYLHAGYQWPNEVALEDTHPRFAKLIRILKKEMIHEQVQYTSTGKITFNEPVGKHNDLVHGWELSLQAVMKFQERNLGYEKRSPEKSTEYSNTIEDIYKDYPMEETLSDAVYDKVPGSNAMF
jgi:hypothetical protein